MGICLEQAALRDREKEDLSLKYLRFSHAKITRVIRRGKILDELKSFPVGASLADAGHRGRRCWPGSRPRRPLAPCARAGVCRREGHSPCSRRPEARCRREGQQGRAAMRALGAGREANRAQGSTVRGVKGGPARLPVGAAQEREATR
jgi:hypothetical protein